MFVEQRHTAIALSLGAVLALSTSCASPEPATTETTVDASTGAAAPSTDTPDPRPAPVTAPQGQDPQGQESLANQRARFLVQQYLEDAKRLRIDNRLDEALALLTRAKDLMPTNQEVLNELAAVNAELNPGHAGVGKTYAEQMEQLWRIREARARAEAMDRLQAGEAAVEAEKFDEAVEHYRTVLLHIDSGPDLDWGNLRDEASNKLAAAEQAREDFETRKQEAVEREILQQRRLEEEAEQARLQTQVDGYLEQAVRAFDNSKYELAQDLAFEAMQIDPTSHLARDIHNSATKALRESRADRYIRQKRDRYAQFLEAAQDLRIPQTDILRVDPLTWEIANGRRSQVLPDLLEDPDNKAVRDQVTSKQVPPIQFTEETGDYNDVVKLLRTITGIPIILTPEAKQVLSDESLLMEIDVVAPIPVSSFLDIMTGKSENLAWTVRNGVVEMTSKAKAGGDNIMVTHDIRDLVAPRTTFLPPTIRDIPAGDVGVGGPRTGGEGDEKIAYIEADVLQENVKAATGGDTYWDVDGGGAMDFVESGYLIVYANPETQKRVEAFLEDQRRFATSVVTVETKFLTITQNFLQELGVDFRGLGGAGNKGTEATLDDITNMLDDNASRGLDNQGTGDAAGNPSSGAFFNDGGDGDVRARTENFFASSLGQALSTSGGATAAFSLIDDLELQLIFRAIEKEEEVQLVNTQQLTVLNNERANMAVINQTSYIRDFDVEVAQAAFIADPKVDVIQDGIVLDVRPTIAHDRKHIMLSLQPTVAELARPIPTFTTSLAGTSQPVTLQLPTLTVRSFATTASIPDGGSVLLGGLREVRAKERRAEIPFLSDIPVISFFFKQEGVSDENRSLAVLVTATITDLTETGKRRR